MQTPTLPVAWAYPVAACPAPCSWRTRTCRTAESNSGSYAGRIAPPGIPKTTSTPTASRDRTRLWAPVIPVAGCGLAGVCRAVVSTPRVAAAAASVGGTGVAGSGPAPGAATAGGRAGAVEPGAAAGRPVLLLVLISTISLGAGWGAEADACRGAGWPVRRSRPTKNPSCRWHGGVARRSGGTGALGDRYELASAGHSDTLRLGRRRRQPQRLTVREAPISFVGRWGC